jgi:predicted nucleotidyltransferase component of viral defense system
MTIDIATHKNILVKVLKDIFTNHIIAPHLGFKGGTAALLFYDLNRFSVDLDFDLLEPSKEIEIFEIVKNILDKYGTVKAQNKRYSLFFLLVYQDKQAGAQNIKVEINKRNFGSKFQVKQYLGIVMQVMVPADMAANKLVAMHERIGKTNRDIFDVWFFLSNNWPVNQKIIELRTNTSYREFLNTCITELEQMSDRNILSGIGELLDAKQKAWTKINLRNDTIFLLKLALSNQK